MLYRALIAAKENAGTILLTTCLAASLCTNVVLGWRLKQSPPPQSRSAGVPEHVVLGPIALTDRTGRHFQLTFDEQRPTLLYILSPSCAWCKRNQANIAALALAAKTRFRVVGISISASNWTDYVTRTAPPFEVFLLDSPDAGARIGLDVTPQTLLIAPGGRVTKAWVGAFFADRQKQVERFFGVLLPGLI